MERRGMEQEAVARHGSHGRGADDIWLLAEGIGADPLDMDFVCPVAVRISPDRVHLQILLEPDARHAPRELLVSLVQEQCQGPTVGLTLTTHEAERYLSVCREGEWVTVASGTPAVPPVDGGVDLLVPLTVTPDAQQGQRGRCAVRAHAPLARLRQGVRGAAGRDIVGREIPVRPPRASRLPRGENTYASADGMVLLAGCDGEIVLRNLLVHVLPLPAIDGDGIAVDQPVEHSGDLFVRGSVPEGRIIAATGNIYVEGDVLEARVTSSGGCVCVGGSIIGEDGQHCVIEAATQIFGRTALHATLRADGSIHLQEGRYSVFATPGSVYLRRGIAESLHDVTLRIGGGLISATPPPPPPDPAPTIRQHFRVPTSLAAEVAIYGAHPLLFAAATVEDLSAGGARCRVASSVFNVLTPGALVHLKFALAEGKAPVVLVGRIARVVARNVVGVAFVDLSEHDRTRLSEYCVELARIHPSALLSTPADREDAGSPA